MKLLLSWTLPTFSDLDWFVVDVTTIALVVVGITVYSVWLKA